MLNRSKRGENMSRLATGATPYVLGDTSGEHERLRRQSRLLDRITRHWLENIGVRAGMRIFDVGSGVGDMAMLLVSLAGPTAEIIGVRPRRVRIGHCSPGTESRVPAGREPSGPAHRYLQ